jgi:hypothetical protein
MRRFATIVPFFSRQYAISMLKIPLGTQGKTAKSCPESGVWSTIWKNSVHKITLAKGDRFPAHKGKMTTWTLERYI